MENQIQIIQVTRVLCCGARTWSLIIGWLETIGSALFILITCILFMETGPFHKEAKGQGLVMFVTGLFASAIQFVSGIILILGVKQQTARKLKIWSIVQMVLVVLFVIEAVHSIFSGGFVQKIVLILEKCFGIWIVNIHRQELLSDLPRGGSCQI